MNKISIENLARKIKLIATDVDGVLTDGSIWIDANSKEPFGKFNIYDGMGITIAHKWELKIVVISGRKSGCSEARFAELGVDEVHTGIANKKAKLLEIAEKLAIDLDSIAYIGDDLIDLGAMSIVGFKVAPKNAVAPVKQYVDYITEAKGGEGVLREVIDLILISQNKYDEIIKKHFE